MIQGEIPSPVRQVGHEPDILKLIEVNPGHRVAQASAAA